MVVGEEPDGARRVLDELETAWRTGGADGRPAGAERRLGAREHMQQFEGCGTFAGIRQSVAQIDAPRGRHEHREQPRIDVS